ncbi:aminotransferase-like domain-containing protein [Agilicoccus flavus]|uniref:aminotransferase-like domain-containing protein n=1 Tax=Agilicoccus flavus TaxID=2775968 RepID=UPI001CF6D02A|nr:PLP-dependent aminotransferase family protein [Agilicoccus flavus]
MTGRRTDLPLAARVGGRSSGGLVDLLALADRPEILSFAVGLPDPLLFDVDHLREAFDAALSGPGAGANLQYSAAEGLPRLRERVAALLTGEGMPTSPASVLVSTGSQQALTLVSTLLLDAGDVVLVEEPTYLAAIEPFRLAGARIVPVASDEDGIDPDALAKAMRTHRPRALYLCPTFANPTGRTLTAARRARVAELVLRHRVWLVEDEPYSRLRYDGDHLAPISADPRLADRSIYLGTFSKIGCPGLRIGWMRVPPAIMPSLAQVKQSADMHTSTLDQAAAAHYLAHADLEGHLRLVCEAYAARRDTMLDLAPGTFPTGTLVSRPTGGMFCWVRLPEGYDALELLPRALAAHVAYVPGAPFYAARPDPRTLRLCFSTYESSTIAEGMDRLAAVFAQTPTPTRPPTPKRTT